MRGRRLLVLALFWALFASLLASACGDGEGVQVDFTRREPEATEPARSVASSTLRLAVAPVISPLESFSLYQELASYMGLKLGQPVEFIQGKTYAEINDLVRTGSVTLAIVCTNPYLQGQEEFGMEAIAAAVPEGADGPYYYSYLIVRRDSPAQSLADLRGLTFAFSDPLSNSGRLTPTYQLALMGETPDSFFRRYIFTYAHDNSIRAVADGLVDGAAVDSLIYDYLAWSEPDLVAKTKVLAKWGPFGNNPVVVNPSLDPTIKALLRQVFLSMHEDQAGVVILRRLRLERFVAPDDSIYDPIREMREYMRSFEVTRRGG